MKKNNNKGFTLGELIVVLVILAILAAILVPTLLGYIDRARSEKDYSTAQSIRVAVQAEIDEIYGKGTDTVAWKDVTDNQDKVFKLVGAVKEGSDYKLDGQKLSLVSGTVTDNQIVNITVSINGKNYHYTSVASGGNAANTWYTDSTN